MIGRHRNAARGPFALPWRTALLVGALGLAATQLERPEVHPPEPGSVAELSSLRSVLGGTLHGPDSEAPDTHEWSTAVPAGSITASHPSPAPVTPAGVQAPDAALLESAPAGALVAPSVYLAE